MFNRDGLSVAVVKDGMAHIRKITVGARSRTSVEVSAGRKNGDQVILNPQVDLTDGRKVTTRAPAQPDRAPTR